MQWNATNAEGKTVLMACDHDALPQAVPALVEAGCALCASSTPAPPEFYVFGFACVFVRLFGPGATSTSRARPPA